MQYPIKVIQLELSQPLPVLNGLEGYVGLLALVRLHGQVLGYGKLPVINGGCDRVTIEQALNQQLGDKIRHCLWTNGLLQGLPEPCPTFADLRALAPAEPELNWPLVTVAVCTRDRPEDLALCLDALLKLDYPHLDLMVVDNAPSDDASQAVVAGYEQVRYLCEPRPGLDWARNLALREAQGEIIAYTDDDVQVDGGWVKAIAQAFLTHPEVMAVTGLVVPAELETEAQVLFETNGGFGKGFEPRKWEFPNGKPIHWSHVGTGNVGTGANMAYRRTLFSTIGDFDPALDVGTATNGAGDLEMFFRVLANGFAVLYEPQAVIFHRHRRSLAELHRQLMNNGAVYAFMRAAAQKFPRLISQLALSGLFWLISGHVLPIFKSLFSPQSFPRSLRWAQLKGCFQGFTSYGKAQKQAKLVEQQHGLLAPLDLLGAEVLSNQKTPEIEADAIAVRAIQLNGQPLVPIADVAGFATTRLFVEHRNRLWGFVDIANDYGAISPTTQAQAMAEQFPAALVSSPGEHWWQAVAIPHHLAVPAAETARLPNHVSVAVVVGTCDRPEDLRHCLQGLTAQVTDRPVEIIVVDNRPDSGLTPPVVEEFSNAPYPIQLVSEGRAGVAYARNAGILAASSEIIVTVDDDVTLPQDWLEKIIAPFARADVMGVTGNVLPLELNSRSQRLFENYGDGGLGRGFQRFEVDENWFGRSWMYAVPTWELGGTANSAYRASVFDDPNVGLMDEALGPGMPSGVGEDIYLFYRLLKSGQRMVYQADAYLWHRHRRDMAALKKQLYNYSKGFISYHLTTVLRDRDYRALGTMLVFLPLYHFKRLLLWPWGDRAYPLWLILAEIQGNLAGPWSLWRSRQRVASWGLSRSSAGKDTTVKATMTTTTSASQATPPAVAVTDKSSRQ